MNISLSWVSQPKIEVGQCWLLTKPETIHDMVRVCLGILAVLVHFRGCRSTPGGSRLRRRRQSRRELKTDRCSQWRLGMVRLFPASYERVLRLESGSPPPMPIRCTAKPGHRWGGCSIRSPRTPALSLRITSVPAPQTGDAKGGMHRGQPHFSGRQTLRRKGSRRSRPVRILLSATGDC